MANAVNRYFGGLLLGGVVGVIAGMLTAPKRGCEMRKDLAESYDDLKREAGGRLSALQHRHGDRPQDGKQLVDNYMGNNSGPMYRAGVRVDPGA